MNPPPADSAASQAIAVPQSLPCAPDDREPPAHAQPRSGSRRWMHLIGFAVFTVILLFAIALLRTVRTQVHVMRTYSTAKAVSGLLYSYAGDRQGLYPDSIESGAPIQTSNDAFRRLFATGYLIADPSYRTHNRQPPILITEEPLIEDSEVERLFGCHDSPHQPDGVLGTCPDYLQTLDAGENHWALVAGLSTTNSSYDTLFMEDPADPSWPPRWNTDADGLALPGRSWNHRRIFIMRNDGSGDFYKLAPGPGLQPIAPDANGATPFNRPPHPLEIQSHRILDVED